MQVTTPETNKVKTSSSLEYAYPCVASLPTASPSMLPRDVLLARNLTLDSNACARSEPKLTNVPISKDYTHPSTLSDDALPINDIIAKSKSIIENYVVDLPYSKQHASTKQRQQELKRTPTKTPAKSKRTPKETSELPSNRGVKRSRSDQDDKFRNSESPANKTPASCHKIITGYDEPTSTTKSQVPNKTIFFSPSVSAKKTNPNLQSTPKSVLHESNNYSNKKTRSTTKSRLLKLSEQEAQPANGENKENNATQDDSDYDHLACHADNIMRMAVDSTMLGSSYNASFSSTFSNVGGADDSGYQRRKYPDFLPESDDADKSVLETLKKKWNSNLLAKSKATKIEINEDDLQKAVNES